MNIQIEHQPHQIRTIKTQIGNQFTIALPPISIIKFTPEQPLNNPCAFGAFRICGNFYSYTASLFYCSDPRLIGESNFHETFWDATFPRGYPMRIGENLTITSFDQWHELTQQNPNFMQEQFDPNWLDHGDVIYANPTTGVSKSLNGSYLFGRRKSLACAKSLAPIARSIRVNRSLRKISLPEITLVLSSPNEFFCLTKTRDGNYIPFYLPNVDLAGFVCMGSYNPRDCPFDYFWNSSFEQSPRLEIHVNPNLSINSVEQWEKLTQQNPNFMQEQFDPIHAEKYSPIIYRFKPFQDSRSILSWTFQ